MGLTLTRSTKSKSSEVFPSLFSAIFLGALLVEAVGAAGFAARVSPPRYELNANPGDVIRDVLEIGNADSATARFVVRSADWDLNEDGGVIIHPPELQPGSCRPWTRIERRSLTLPPEAVKRFRFEIHVPDDAAAGECRFALLIAPDPQSEAALAQLGDLRFPITGQIAVIVYVAVGGAKPMLDFRNIHLAQINGQTVPVTVFHNAGNAHGRPLGLLEGSDANGQGLDFVVSPAPILPGRTVSIALWPRSPQDAQQSVDFVTPVRIRGPIEWDGGEVDVDTTLE